jgi:hypothetical protein
METAASFEARFRAMVLPGVSGSPKWPGRLCNCASRRIRTEDLEKDRLRQRGVVYGGNQSVSTG